MTKKRTFLRDVNSLIKSVGSVTADQVQVLVDSLEGEDVENERHHGSIKVEVAPSDGAYKGGKFEFEIYVVNEYPECPPEVRCLTEIYHPNIDTDDSDDATNICVSLLESGEWDPNMTLEHCIQAVLFLFYNPNWGDALSPLFSPDLTETDFEENVKISIEGGDIEGRVFERNYGFVVSDNVANNADGAKLTNQEIELNNINNALNNVTMENETSDHEVIPTETQTTESEARVVAEENPVENNVPACETGHVNIVIPATQEVDQAVQEVDPITQEIVGQEAEQLETGLVAISLSDNEAILEKTQTDSTSEETSELITNSGEVHVNVTENEVNTDQGEIIKSDTVDNILSAMILDFSAMQNLKTDKQGGFLHRSLSVGDSPRGNTVKLDRNAMVGVSIETDNKSGVCLGTREGENFCDVRTDKTDMAHDSGATHPFIVDDLQQLLPAEVTRTDKDPRVTSHDSCCGNDVVCCNVS
ncbi:uncharacterized protein LOC110461850 [Mizuhopecten yessoensis]|uniref:NEDD8-conjugating enzyme ubc12 n=1 Tax=Mizuhopecten yessoensis TaxID=6573 RepID=A0A210PZG3_MIZYE|nr:uncharacterized protein LOC110461850 [Mizuhopecten yessoensis]OWF41872.1 NEDD8-conjugating enzyme ubc12 [Mizuhopecten yessoensis]